MEPQVLVHGREPPLMAAPAPKQVAPRSAAVLLSSAAVAACVLIGLHLLYGPAGASSAGVRGRRGLAAPPEHDDLAPASALLAAWPDDKPRACIVILARNSDLQGVLSSVSQLERRFNAAPEAQYPYCYLNDKPFSAEFRAAVSAAAVAPSFFGLVPPEHWSYPPHINTTRAAELRDKARKRMPYGGSESYRFMCRYFSGFFFDHPLLRGFDWYWRVEPDVHFMCDLPAPAADPFRHMQAHNQSLAWTIVMEEVPATIPGLWPAVQHWLAANPQLVPRGNLLPAFLQQDASVEQQQQARRQLVIRRAGAQQPQSAEQPLYANARYTGCHFWSNFEVGRLDFFRSAAYRSFFAHLDSTTGFFYERWGDAPVHTLAAAALLTPDEVYFARDIGYKHGSWSYCPPEPEDRRRCDCHPSWYMHTLAQPRCQLDFLTRLRRMQASTQA